MSPRVTVVVLARGDEARLRDCLASVTAQRLPESLAAAGPHPYGEVEVLLAGADEVRAEGVHGVRPLGTAGSRGADRNRGAAHAAGEYVMFLDGDDVLSPGALEVLAAALGGGADVASGGIGLIDGELEDAPVGVPGPRRRVSLSDRQVANMMFRRSFWEARGLAFPELDRHEDLAVALSAQALGRVTVVAPEVVRRSTVLPVPSDDAADLAATFDAVHATLRAMRGHWGTRERRRFLGTVLDREVRAFLDVLPDATPERREKLVEAAAGFLRSVDHRALAGLPALTRLKWHLAERGLIGELVKVVRYERGRSDPAIVRNPIRRYVVYPYWKDDKLAIPEDVYLARDEVRLRSRVHDVGWEDGRLVVSGEAFIHSVSSARKWTALKGVVLHTREGGRDGRSERRVRLLARQITGPGAKSGAWTGFRVTLDPARLRERDGWRDASWDVHAAVFNAGVYRRARVAGGTSGSGGNPPYRYVADGVRIIPEVTRGEFRLRVETVRALATGLSWTADALVVTGAVRSGVPIALRLRCGDDAVTVPVGTAERPVPAQAAWNESTVAGGGFTATVPLEALRRAAGHTAAGEDAIDDTARWSTDLLTETGILPLVAAEEIAEAHRLVGDREATADRGPGGYLRVSVRTARLQVTGCGLDDRGVLTVTGRHPAASGGEYVLSARGRRARYGFAALPREDGELAAEIPLTAIAGLAGILPLRQGDWDLLFRENATTPALAVTLAPGAEEALPKAAEVARRAYRLVSRDGRPVVGVTGDVRPEERNRGTRLREEARRQVAKTGLRDAVLFSCFNGRQYADSPRAIHEELARRHPELEQLWVVGDGQVELPPTAKPVRYQGAEWQEALSSARHLVVNHRIGDWFQRHPGQTVVQTWHGTPLKKIGRDVKEVHFAYAPGMRKAHRSREKAPAAPVPEWTHLVSPNPFSTEIMRRAFRFEGEIIEAGYPRNDLLYSPDAAAIAERVRRKVGVPPGKKAVLYAPTWRDDRFYGRGRYKLDWRIDLDGFRRVLGDDHVLLVRLHPNVVDGAPEDDLVYDVSAYPDIAELYLAADVLVSDYSSVMFDFANTGRPMLFYTYDLEHYRDTLRGFYFDFAAQAPGPLLSTSAELVAALRDIDAVAAEHKGAYGAFRERFCSLEDGKAAARVIDAVFPA